MKKLLLCAALAASCQTKKPEPPKIPDNHKIAWLKASKKVAEMSPAWQTANAEQERQVKQLADDCGKSFDPKLDASGEPYCEAKPKK